MDLAIAGALTQFCVNTQFCNGFDCAHYVTHIVCLLLHQHTLITKVYCREHLLIHMAPIVIRTYGFDILHFTLFYMFFHRYIRDCNHNKLTFPQFFVKLFAFSHF